MPSPKIRQRKLIQLIFRLSRFDLVKDFLGGMKCIGHSRKAAISVFLIILSLTILRAFHNWIIIAVIIYAALQFFNCKQAMAELLT